MLTSSDLARTSSGPDTERDAASGVRDGNPRIDHTQWARLYRLLTTVHSTWPQTISLRIDHMDEVQAHVHSVVPQVYRATTKAAQGKYYLKCHAKMENDTNKCPFALTVAQDPMNSGDVHVHLRMSHNHPMSPSAWILTNQTPLLIRSTLDQYLDSAPLPLNYLQLAQQITQFWKEISGLENLQVRAPKFLTHTLETTNDIYV